VKVLHELESAVVSERNHQLTSERASVQ
jgi:hypothetical protein